MSNMTNEVNFCGRCDTYYIEKCRCEPSPDPAGEDCPSCPNQGWYYVGTYGEQEQCEWCCTNPESKFSKQNKQ